MCKNLFFKIKRIANYCRYMEVDVDSCRFDFMSYLDVSNISVSYFVPWGEILQRDLMVCK